MCVCMCVCLCVCLCICMCVCVFFSNRKLYIDVIVIHIIYIYIYIYYCIIYVICTLGNYRISVHTISAAHILYNQEKTMYKYYIISGRFSDS